MTSSRVRQLAVLGFVAGAAFGAITWSQVQRQFRRDLFSRHPVRRFMALTYLQGRPSMGTAHLLREYVAWEQTPLLRQRGVTLIRRLDKTLE